MSMPSVDMMYNLFLRFHREGMGFMVIPEDFPALRSLFLVVRAAAIDTLVKGDITGMCLFRGTTAIQETVTLVGRCVEVPPGDGKRLVNNMKMKICIGKACIRVFRLIL